MRSEDREDVQVGTGLRRYGFRASGFVGRHTVQALARDGWRVCAASRRPDLALHLQPLGGVGQIYPVQTNVRYPESVQRAVKRAQAVVNLVGISSPSGPQTFEAVHVGGARTIARAAREAGIRSLVHMSAIRARPDSSSHYARSKAEGEDAVLRELPTGVVLRPSLMFGPEDQLFNRFAAMACVSPVLPLIGGGRAQLQPVYACYVAAAIAAACAGKARPHTIYEIGGPEVLS